MATMVKTSTLVASVLFGTLAGGGLAWADAIPPEVEDCQNLKAGDACMLGKSRGSGTTRPGTCVSSVCGGFDYEHWDRDASSSPPSKSYTCYTCVAGSAVADGGPAPGDGATSEAGGADSSADGPVDAPVDTHEPDASGGAAAGNSGNAGTSGTAGVSGTAGHADIGSSGQAGISGSTVGAQAGASAGASGAHTTVAKNDDGGGCAVGGNSARALGPWLLAGIFGVLVSLVRRRRR